MSDDDESGYEIIMPFLPVISNGGPYDDDAFVAGFEMGLLDARLAQGVFDQGQPIHAENREQADLIAMRHGYVAEFTANIDGFWVCMNARPADSEAQL